MIWIILVYFLEFDMKNLECNIDTKCKHLIIHEYKDKRIKPQYLCKKIGILLKIDDNFNIEPFAMEICDIPCPFKI